MTEMYIRRGGGASWPRRIAIGLGILCLLGAGGFYGFRACRAPAEPRPVDAASDPEAAAESATGFEPAIEPDAKPALTQNRPPAPKPDAPPAGEASDDGTPDPGIRLIAAAEQLAARGQLLEARERAWETTALSTHEPALDRARSLLGTLHTELLTSPRSMPEKTEYTVRPGDSLAKLAKEFNTTIELIQRGNNLTGSMIRIGDRLRIFSGEFHVYIDKSDNLLDLYLNDRFFKRYEIGTGEYNRTPVGDFRITDRIHQPTWWRPDGRAIPYGDPDNELGTHWLSLDIRGYGLHGTWEPETIGHQASAGCVRMLNDHIAELYMLLPLGTPVTIVD